MVGSLPDGSLGFDIDSRISLVAAQEFYRRGFRFAVRYVRRTTYHPEDITVGEIRDLHAGKLGVMLVQHVSPENWIPSLGLGSLYGSTAAQEARTVGYPTNATLWLDLEGVHRSVNPANPTAVIQFCNAWFDAVVAAGYSDPGIYIGFAPGLDNTQLYQKLKFKRYWKAYNADHTPIVRGYQMIQGAYPPVSQRVMRLEYDTDTIKHDSLGGTPAVFLP